MASTILPTQKERSARPRRAESGVKKMLRIRMTRNGHRNGLACVRPDGTSLFTDIGPGLPHHDLAHYVVEHRFGLKEGFFGNIARGYTFAQLSDKEVIKRLGPESMVAEILARALQSLSSGACGREQFEELVGAEFEQWGIPRLVVPPATTDDMAEEFRSLLQRFAALADRESMTLDFDVEDEPADVANGWDAIAEEFIARRDKSRIGVVTLRRWAASLPAGASVLDLGCGSGTPLSAALMEDGFDLWGVEASPRLVAEFQKRFSRAHIACEEAESSGFFGHKFDGVIAIGLVFLLSPAAQTQLLRRIPAALKPGARFLFTAPMQVVTWPDILTGRESRSLGKDAYAAILADAGLSLSGEYTDEGGNHYYDFLLPSG